MEEIIFLSELMVQDESKIIPLAHGGGGGNGAKHCSMTLTTLSISLACVESTNIISGHKIIKPTSELTTELASMTISPTVYFILTTEIVILKLYPNLSAINFK